MPGWRGTDTEAARLPLDAGSEVVTGRLHVIVTADHRVTSESSVAVSA